MGMKAVIPNAEGRPPCLVYWTGQVRLHVGVVTYCDEDRRTNDGVLQVPDATPCCTKCEHNAERGIFPKPRR